MKNLFGLFLLISISTIPAAFATTDETYCKAQYLAGEAVSEGSEPRLVMGASYPAEKTEKGCINQVLAEKWPDEATRKAGSF